MHNFFFFISLIVGILIGRVAKDFSLFIVFLAILLFFSSYFFHRKNKPIAWGICFFLFFTVLGTLWSLPKYFTTPEEVLAKSKRFHLKVISFPKRVSIKQIYFAQIFRVDDSPFYLKTRVVDFSPLSKEYLSKYQVEGKLSLHIYKGRKFYTLWISKDTSQLKYKDRWIEKFLKKVTFFLTNLYRSELSAQAYSFLSATFLGRRELLSRKVRKIFAASGTSHLLAISGLHIGMTALVLIYLLRFFKLIFPKRIVISILFLFFYTFLVGARASTLRAAIMYTIFGISFLLQRKTHPLNSLGLSGIISLFINPLWIFDVGFQLSFISVLGIILGYRTFKVSISSSTFLGTYFKNILFTSLFVLLSIGGLTSYYFGKVYISSILTNWILIPLFVFIIFVNFLFIILSFFPFLGECMGSLVSFLIFWFIKVAGFFSWLSRINLNFYSSRGGVIIYYLILISIGSLIYRFREKLGRIKTVFKRPALSIINIIWKKFINLK
ncbi:MAG: ComEC/Rec2 family competence protein [Candidatus Omnitrophica bacterium]|nr:ComEC/Rec2 family competence protein [Candidatus Omnitrophota bacterium]